MCLTNNLGKRSVCKDPTRILRSRCSCQRSGNCYRRNQVFFWFIDHYRISDVLKELRLLNNDRPCMRSVNGVVFESTVEELIKVMEKEKNEVLSDGI